MPLAAALLAVLILMILTFGVRSATAAEAPFKIEFDSSAIQVSVIEDLPLDSLSTKASIEGTIDENGNVTIPKGGFKMPELGITEPVAVKGFMGIEAPATGTFDAATGRLELDTKAGLWVSVNIRQLLDAASGLGFDLGDSLGSLTPFLGLLGQNLTCGFSPMDVRFSTEPNSLATGKRFAGGTGGPGAISAEWSKLGPFTGRTKVAGLFDVCKILRDQLPALLEGLGGTGTGGLDIGGLLDGLDLSSLDAVDLGPSAITLTKTSVDPEGPGDPDGPGGPGDPVVPGQPATAKLKLSVTPKIRRARAGTRVLYRATVRNAGGREAVAVKVCIKAPRNAAKVKRCHRIGTLAPGAKRMRKFNLKLKKSAGRRSYRIGFETRSSTGGKRRAMAGLRIR